MTPDAALAHTRTASAPSGIRLGERLRQLRVAAGLTQSDLAGERFSKEYISQIERGKTRPTRETIEWLSLRLGVDPTFLASGVSTDEYANALAAVLATGAVELQVRILSGEAWSRAHTGDVKPAIDLLTQARGLV